MLKTTIFLLFTVLLLNSCRDVPAPDKSKTVHKFNDQIHSESNVDSVKIQYIDTLYQYLLPKKNDSLNRIILFDVVRNYFILNDNETFLEASQKMLQFSIEGKDSLHMAKSLCYIGDYYEDQTQLDSAFKYYAQSEKLYRINHDTIGLGKSTLYKAGILYDAGIFTESEVQTAHALQYLIRTNNVRLIYESYNLMGLNLKELGNYENSLHYFNLALQELHVMERSKYSSEKLLKSRATIYNNIGNLFEKKEEHKRAIEYYKEGLEVENIELNCPALYSMLLDNLAYSQMKSGSLTSIDSLFKESTRIRDSLQLKSGIVTGLIHLGEFHIKTKDTLKGLFYLEKGFKKAKGIKSTYDLKNALRLLSINDNTKGDYYTKLYIRLSDSLQNVERATRNTFARISYETDQVVEKNENLVKKYISTVVLFSIALLFIGTVFIIYRLKSKNKELQFIQEQQESNEKIYQLILEQQQQNQSVRDEERNRIAMELHDGIVNRIFTTRFNLMQLQPEQVEKKELLVQELIAAETEIRKVSHDLQQNLLFEDNSFQKTLGALVLGQSNTYQTVFDFSIDTYIDWNLVSNENKVHIYRISQEALHNVNKYAHATKCFIFIMKIGTQISLQIIDNGIGFETDKIKTGIGLKNIQQRASNMGGSFQITSKPEGTTLEVLF